MELSTLQKEMLTQLEKEIDNIVGNQRQKQRCRILLCSTFPELFLGEGILKAVGS